MYEATEGSDWECGTVRGDVDGEVGFESESCEEDDGGRMGGMGGDLDLVLTFLWNGLDCVGEEGIDIDVGLNLPDESTGSGRVGGELPVNFDIIF